MTDINVPKIAIDKKVPNSDGNSIFGFAQLFPEDQDSFTRFLLVFVRSNRLSFLKAKSTFCIALQRFNLEKPINDLVLFFPIGINRKS